MDAEQPLLSSGEGESSSNATSPSNGRPKVSPALAKKRTSSNVTNPGLHVQFNIGTFRARFHGISTKPISVNNSNNSGDAHGDEYVADDLNVLQELLDHGEASPAFDGPGQAKESPAKTDQLGRVSSWSSAVSDVSFANKGSAGEQAPREVTKVSWRRDSLALLQVLVELYDLKLHDEANVDGCWDETARWIKYEEVEMAALRVTANNPTI